MTDLGRGYGNDPWHPGDPLYGDPEWAAQTAPTAGWDGYATAPAAAPQHGQRPPQPQIWGPADPAGAYGAGQGHPYGGPDRHGQGPYYDPAGGYPGQPDPYGGQGPYGPMGGPHPGADPYGPAHDPYGGPNGYGNAGTTYGQAPYAPGDYREDARFGDGIHPGEEDHGTPSGTPQELPPADRRAARRNEPDVADPPGREEDHDPHPFFSDGDADRDEGEGHGRQEGRRRKEGRKEGRKSDRDKGRTRRSGCACLMVVLVLGGAVSAVGYYGYTVYQNNFAAAPDYTGSGKGEVQVEIPDGAFSADIAKILAEAGVVKSAEAFIEAAQVNDRAARSIQPGVYILKKEMSAATALELLTDSTNINALIIREGLRATQVYAEIDKKLGLKKGTTEKAAENADLGLPEYAKGNPEGFLYPSRYSVGKNTEPLDLIRQMVKQAKREYERDNLEQSAKGVGRTPYEVIIIASIIQAEAQEDKDFGKVSRVIYNRLDTNATWGRLDMDSTINYALNRSTLDTSTADTRLNHPYNTYVNKGLPPGPIGNPGHQAIEAALNPAKGDWVYFVTVKPGDTRFAVSKAEHDRNVTEFNRYQAERKSQG